MMSVKRSPTMIKNERKALSNQIEVMFGLVVIFSVVLTIFLDPLRENPFIVFGIIMIAAGFVGFYLAGVDDRLFDIDIRKKVLISSARILIGIAFLINVLSLGESNLILSIGHIGFGLKSLKKSTSEDIVVRYKKSFFQLQGLLLITIGLLSFSIVDQQSKTVFLFAYGLLFYGNNRIFRIYWSQ
ncbi:MAG: hypothetical protein IH840_02800 [Candidatus Heimdallarchaeota archaeon]|nr:hypothetical protein [Candidatus Heimdallarchaeota archaeon]